MDSVRLDVEKRTSSKSREQPRSVSQALAQAVMNELWGPRVHGLWSGTRLRVLRRLARMLERSGDLLVTYELGGRELWLPISHELPFILRDVPQYSHNLARIAAQVAADCHRFTLIDIGANIGDSAALLRQEAHFPILCIEASEKYFRVLTLNMSSLGGDIELERSVVGWSSGVLCGALREERGTAQFVCGEEATPTKTLSEILAQHPRFARPKMIKVDTDGMDCAILRSELELLARAKPVLFFEYSPDLIPSKAEALGIFDDLTSIGYGTVLVYENNGDYLLSAVIGDARRMSELYEFYSGRGIYRYCDLCVFHADDAALADSIRENELAFFRRLRPVPGPAAGQTCL